MHTVVLIGTFPELLKARRDAFEQAGHRVFSYRRVPAALRGVLDLKPDAVVLGHGLSEPERRNICQTIKEQRPVTRIIVLYFGSVSGVELADAVLEVTGPLSDLVAAAENLIVQEQHRRKSSCA